MTFSDFIIYIPYDFNYFRMSTKKGIEEDLEVYSKCTEYINQLRT